MALPSPVVRRSGWSLVFGAVLVVALAACTSGVVDRSPERDGPIAGERGAGVIVSLAPQQVPPASLTVTGRCPDALVRAVD